MQYIKIRRDLDFETQKNYRLRRAIEEECGEKGDDLCTNLKGECKLKSLQKTSGSGRCDGALIFDISKFKPKLSFKLSLPCLSKNFTLSQLG